MKKAKSNNTKRWKVYAGIAGLYFLVNVGMISATGVASYPTEKHLQVGREIQVKTERAWQSDNLMEALESPELKKLDESPENRQTIIAGFVGLGVSLAVWLMFVRQAYYYLRRKRVSASPLLPIAVIEAGISGIAFLFSQWFGYVMGYPQTGMFTGAIEIGATVIAIITTMLFSFGMTLLVGLFIQSRYNKKHSMVVE